MNAVLVVAFLVCLAAAVGDARSTHKAIKHRGYHEGNKRVAWLIRKLGIWPALVLTKLIVLGLGAFMWWGDAPGVAAVWWFGTGIAQGVLGWKHNRELMARGRF